MANMLISALARTAEISANIPVKEKSKAPETLMQDHPDSFFSEFSSMEELQTIDNSSSDLLML